MKKPEYNIEERIPIWICLSDFYLDTELQTQDFKNFAVKIVQSPYSIEEVKWINKYEVFPVLQYNLLSVAGEWAGFNEEWLIKEITRNISQRNFFRNLKIEFNYKMHKWMCSKYWHQLEKEYYPLIQRINR